MELSLQVAGFLDNSLVNGKGLRSVLFVSGCKHNCLGCHNKEMQAFDYGEKVAIEDIFNRIYKNVPIIKGVTFSGGEPFEQAVGLAELARIIKKKKLSLWCYTGYTFEDILRNKNDKEGWSSLIENIDVLVDGKFEKNNMDSNLKYRGSRNQRIIDVQNSIIEKKIILFYENK